MIRETGMVFVLRLVVAGLVLLSACAAQPRLASDEPVADGDAPDGSRADDSLRQLERLAAERRQTGGPRSYRIGPGDQVEISVFDLKELNRKVRVSLTGELLLPLVGSVPAAGKTEAELGRDIADRLAREYLQTPQVDVFVSEYRSSLVAVTGAVGKPGLYPLTRERNTMLDLISEAGGLTRAAGGFIDFLPARSAAASQAMKRARSGDVRLSKAAPPSGGITIDLAELMRGSNRTLLHLPIIPGDVIFVPQSGMFSIEGWVEQPGSYPITRGMTVLSAISAGGGALFPAELSRVELFREDSVSGSGGTRRLVDVTAVREGRGKDVTLRAGDVVRVPANALRLAPYSVYWMFRNFIWFGLGGGTQVPVS